MSKSVYIIGAVLILAFVAMGATELVRSQMPYCQTLEQVKAAGAGSQVQLIGTLVPGSASVSASGDLHFSLRDEDGASSVVSFKGIKPAGFETAPKLLLHGTYGEAGFAANDIQTQCPSKYQSE